MTQAYGNQHSRRTSLLKRFFLLLALPLLGLIILFGWFFVTALTPPPQAYLLPHTDGIVALTGGQKRIETSLKLLLQNRGDKLLISGVSYQTADKDLLPPLPDTIKTRITLGYQARSTIGNATETATWVADNHIHSLIIVTAGYHMRRAMLELERTLPGVTLYAYPVTPPALTRPLTLTTLRLLLTEYFKWIGALAGITQNPSKTVMTALRH